MPARIFTRAIAGCEAGQIADLDWTAFRASALRHHGVKDDVDAYSLPLEEAARRYVASLQADSAVEPAVERVRGDTRRYPR